MQSESINWREALVLTVVAALLVGTVAVTGHAQFSQAVAKLEAKQLGDLVMATQKISAEQRSKWKLKDDKAKGLVGRGFFEYCFKHKLFDSDMRKKCVAIISGVDDKGVDLEFFDDDKNVAFTQANCSYATPKCDELLATIYQKGDKRRILYCWDSRNWLNQPASGALVAWSDGETGEYIDAAKAKGDYAISAEDFALPGEKLFGKVKPFEGVFEEEASTKGAVEMRAENERCKIYTELFKKKGRSWTLQGQNRPGDNKEIRVKQEVVEVTDAEARLKWTVSDLEGNPVAGAPNGTVVPVSLVNAIALKPRGKRDGDKTEEIEAAGRKWNCEKWVSEEGGQTTHIWSSTEFPGLTVLAKDKDGKELIKLIEFNDPK